MIDLHCHVLPGIDDGPEKIESSLALARAAAALGTRTLVATPHVNRRFPNDPASIGRLVDQLNRRLREDDVALEILAGGEIAMTYAPNLSPGELTRLRIGTGRWLLIEPSFTREIAGLEALVADLHDAGHRVLLAHPERCTAFHRDPLLLASLVQRGVLTSITAGSLVGRFGEHVRRFAMQLAREGLIHNVASDAHDRTRRPPGMAEEIERAGLGALGEWFTQTVPAAILNGAEEVPPRPVPIGAAHEGRSWWRRRRKIA
jgi:protein-tyrosine phosphatase